VGTPDKVAVPVNSVSNRSLYSATLERITGGLARRIALGSSWQIQVNINQEV